ncbi:hypothetical protein B0O99DRAFT_595541 [Bisporella sp. PMI_857]|nr:hypothetical protein B0O99DRAFT_595541 [Bisporella sp. PMI_857]
MTKYPAKPDNSSRATSTFTTSMMYTTTLNNVQATSEPSPAATSDLIHASKSFWQNLALGAKIAIIAAIIIGIIAVTIFSMWFCCGCCGGRVRYCGKRKRDEVTTGDARSLPLHTSLNRSRKGSIGNGETSPPRYEEALLPRHNMVVGGVVHDREEEGIVADGKTPLSEILFEDVIVDHKPSECSSGISEKSYNGNGRDTGG